MDRTRTKQNKNIEWNGMEWNDMAENKIQLRRNELKRLTKKIKLNKTEQDDMKSSK